MQLWSWVNLRIEDRLQESFGMSKKKNGFLENLRVALFPSLQQEKLNRMQF